MLNTGDIIEIDITGRKINVRLSGDELHKRAKDEKLKGDKAYHPKLRKREIPASLRAYAATVSSADLGAVRQI